MALLHEIVITAIIIKDGKYLITKRCNTKKRFPGIWTVPGGRLETDDYINDVKETKDYWYNVLEKCLAREVLEETGLIIENVKYITSLATIHTDGTPSIVISCAADYKSGEVRLQIGETIDAKWVSLEQAKEYDLLDGIYDELAMTDNVMRGEKIDWQRAENK